MSAEEIDEMGPIDYLVVEWPGKQPTGEAAPLLVDLVDRGLIRILDLAFIAKGEDGSVAGIEISDLGEQVEELKVFEGASSGLLGRRGRRRGRRGARTRHLRRAARLREHAGRRRLRAPSASPGASSSPTAASRSKPSSRRSTPPRPTTDRKEHRHAWIAQRSRPHGGHRGNRDHRQQPRLTPAGPALGRAGPGSRARASAARRRPRPPPPIRSQQLKELGELHQSGVLTDEEFAAQKAKLLG